MKKSILIILALLLSTALIQAGDVDLGYKMKETSNVKKTITFDQSNNRILEIDNVFGGITITGTDSDKIELKAVKLITGKDKSRLEQAKKEVSLDITSKNGTIRVYVNGPFRNKNRNTDWHKKYGYMVEYDFQLNVPRNLALKLNTASNGDIHVKNTKGHCEIHHANGEISVKQLTGDFDIHTANGKIIMNDINGSGNAKTANGKIDVTFTQNPKTNCTFHTVNGKVSLQFQSGLAADFRLKTSLGKILSDFDFTYKSLPQPKGKREKGKFVYKSGDFQAIRIGGGGPVIAMNTMNGNLIIAKGK